MDPHTNNGYQSSAKIAYHCFWVMVILVLLMVLFSCSVPREYFTINEIQYQFGLTNKECKVIQKDSTIESFYHCEKGRMYKLKDVEPKIPKK